MKIPSKKTLISLAVIISLILVIIFVRTMTFRKAAFYTKLNTGQDVLSGIDDKRIFEIKYPKVLTKNGLRPEIENELYTDSRDKECSKNEDGPCVPSKGSFMEISLGTVKKEKRKFAEQYLLGAASYEQTWLKDLSDKEAEEVDRMIDIYHTCFYNISTNHDPYFEASRNLSDREKYLHPEDFFVELKAGEKMLNIDYRKISRDVNFEFDKNNKKCEDFLSENKK